MTRKSRTDTKPFRFGVQSYHAETGSQWRDRARRAEDLGFYALTLADHFLGPGPALESTNHPLQTLAAVPAMAVAAECTSTLRVGCRVFCMDYRHPVILAKEAATIDLLSEGRLDFGIGAGWLQAEYEAVGMTFDAASVRITRLEEAVKFIKQIWSGEPLEFEGDFFSASGFSGSPVPLQKPHPRIMIGGGGRRVLSLAAREADIVSLNFNNRSGVLGRDGVQTGTPAKTAEKVGWVEKAAGDRMKDVTLEIGAYFTFVTDDPMPIASGMGGIFGLTPEEMMAHPHALMGTADAICDELERRREEFGLSYFTIGDDQMEAFAPVVARLAGK
jgi:probable F420-dependent oxidoreductase